MKSLRTLTLAATLALIGMAGGYAGDAQAQTGDLATPTAKPVAVQGLLLPAVQKVREGSDGVADLVTGAGAGKPGEANALIGLLRPGEQSGHTDGTLPAVQFPTDQKNGDGRADLVTGAGGANGQTWTGPVTLGTTSAVGTAGLQKTGTGTLTLAGTTSYGSLGRLGSVNDLFANSRGGDQAAGAHGSGGGGGAGKVTYQDTNYGKPGDGSVMPTDQIAAKDSGGQAGAHGAGGGGGAGKVVFQDMNFTTKVAKGAEGPNTFANPTNGGTQLPAVQAIREAAKSPAASGGGQAAGGAKAMTMQNAARK